VLQLGHSILVHTANQIYNNEDCTDSSPDCLVAGRSNEDTLQSTYHFVKVVLLRHFYPVQLDVLMELPMNQEFPSEVIEHLKMI
jgi:hypothetical protein